MPSFSSLLSGARFRCRNRALVCGLILFFTVLNLTAREPETRFRYDRYSGIPVATIEQARAMMLLRHVNAPMVGETAPESEPFDARTGVKTSLYDLIGEKPLVLLFGSASCSQMELYQQDLAKFTERFGDRFEFAFVYIREAHPEGGFMPELQRDGEGYQLEAVADAPTLESRKKVAIEFADSTSKDLRILVDSIDDEMAVRWGAWPVRVFVIGTDRKLLYSGGPGPWFFHFAEDGWHDPAPLDLDRAFQAMPFSRPSLELFLEGATGMAGGQ